MKLSVSLADEHVEFLDGYAREHGVASRSAVLQRAVDHFRYAQLAASYEGAFAEWEADADAGDWESASNASWPSA